MTYADLEVELKARIQRAMREIRCLFQIILRTISDLRQAAGFVCTFLSAFFSPRASSSVGWSFSGGQASPVGWSFSGGQGGSSEELPKEIRSKTGSECPRSNKRLDRVPLTSHRSSATPVYGPERLSERGWL